MYTIVWMPCVYCDLVLQSALTLTISRETTQSALTLTVSREITHSLNICSILFIELRSNLFFEHFQPFEMAKYILEMIQRFIAHHCYMKQFLWL